MMPAYVVTSDECASLNSTVEVANRIRPNSISLSCRKHSRKPGRMQTCACVRERVAGKSFEDTLKTCRERVRKPGR
jgi:hypothetical protein